MSGCGIAGHRPAHSLPVDRDRLREIATLLGRSVADFYVQATSLPDESAQTVLHVSANGDRWSLVRGHGGLPTVRHVGNAASGGYVTDRSLDAFLAVDAGSPQHAALLRLVEDLLMTCWDGAKMRGAGETS